MMLFLMFVCLQLMDALTTLLFLHYCVGEANPLVRAALAVLGYPTLALTAGKVFAIALAHYAWRTGRHRLLRRTNVLYALVVVWNLIAAAVSGATR